MGWNIQSDKHHKASRMHRVPKLNETELLCNVLMQQKYFDLNETCPQRHIFFLHWVIWPWSLDRKKLKDEEITKPTEETKNEKKKFPLLKV